MARPEAKLSWASISTFLAASYLNLSVTLCWRMALCNEPFKPVRTWALYSH
jgi:hypothetical protein